MYHESTHWTGIQLEDVVLRDGTLAYGWSKIKQLGTFNRLMNADSYMFLGLLARYESLGYYLQDSTVDLAQLGVMVKAPAGWVPP